MPVESRIDHGDTTRSWYVGFATIGGMRGIVENAYAQFLSMQSRHRTYTIRVTLAVIFACLAWISTANLRQHMYNYSRNDGSSILNARLTEDRVPAKLRTSTDNASTTNHGAAITGLHGECENLLNNITNGKWVDNGGLRNSDLHVVTLVHNRYQTRKETQSPVVWRNDGKCGSKK